MSCAQFEKHCSASHFQGNQTQHHPWGTVISVSSSRETIGYRLPVFNSIDFCSYLYAFLLATLGLICSSRSKFLKWDLDLFLT